MHTIKNIERFNLNQLKNNIKSQASWHSDYDSAYIFIGGLNYAMNEADIAIVFSEFGEVVDLRLARDKVTGKSKGFAFLAYEDQRSTVLAVDNFNGCEICGRTLRVDHVKKYKPPRQFMELIEGFQTQEYRPTGPDGRGWGRFREHTEEEKKELARYASEKKANK